MPLFGTDVAKGGGAPDVCPRLFLSIALNSFQACVFHCYSNIKYVCSCLFSPDTKSQQFPGA